MNKQHDNLIILDFDHTIFNTTKYVAALQERFEEEFGISKDDFMKYRNAVKECCVVIDIDTFVHEIPSFDDTVLHNALMDVTRNQSQAFVFPDVHRFLERHKDTFDILIVTHGDKELQTAKITGAKLPDFVQSIISIETKDRVIGRFVDQYKEIHFIDDKATSIDAVKQAHPQVHAYFIQRPEDKPYADKASECECDVSIVEGLDITL